MHQADLRAPQHRQSRRGLLLKIILGIAVLCAGTVLAMPLLLNNAHTRAGYAGWREAGVPGVGSFMLPEEWQLDGIPLSSYLPESLPVTLCGADAAVLAHGYLFPMGVTDAAFNAAAEAIAGTPLSEYRTGGGLTAVLAGRGGAFQSVNFFSDDQLLRKAHCLTLTNGNSALYLWFPWCEGEAYQTLLAQAKAILWSVIF